MAKQYSQAEVDALLNRATAGSDIDAIAALPYQQIKHADGSVLCYPPSDGGPLTVGGLHPNDYFGVNDKGVATKNVDGAESPAPATAARTSASAANDAEYQQYLKDKAARDAAAGSN